MLEDMGIKVREPCRDKDYNKSEQQVDIVKERKSKRELLEELKIKVVTYQEHVDWLDWFEDIRKEHRKAEVEKQKLHNVFSIENPERIAAEGV